MLAHDNIPVQLPTLLFLSMYHILGERLKLLSSNLYSLIYFPIISQTLYEVPLYLGNNHQEKILKKEWTTFPEGITSLTN